MVVTEQDIRDHLRSTAARLGGMQHVADLAGCSLSFISAIACGHKRPTEQILKLLGYERIVTYRRTTTTERCVDTNSRKKPAAAT